MQWTDNPTEQTVEEAAGRLRAGIALILAGVLLLVMLWALT